jgi:DNA-binding transcriptional regulator YdaS (Cro superfamily)
MNIHIEKAIELLGSQTALANACGVKQGNVWNWLNRDKVIQPEVALLIERATKGEITKEQLRPDLYPSEADLQKNENGKLLWIPNDCIEFVKTYLEIAKVKQKMATHDHA